MSTELPALLITKNTKRRFAKEQVKVALRNIRSLGAQAGISDRSMYEFLALSKFIETEISTEA